MSAQNPTILCLETSGLNCGVTLYADGRVQSSLNYWIPQVHDALLGELCQQLLHTHALRADQLDAVAISAGPGSFTGLRIGASLVKGLCFDNTPPLIAVPTLEAIARSAASRARELAAQRIAVLVAAQTGKYYAQFFDSEGLAQAAPTLKDEPSLRSLLLDSDFIVGPAATQFRHDSRAEAWQRLHSEHLLTLALELFHNERFVSAADFRPFYIQDFTPTSTPLKPLID